MVGVPRSHTSTRLVGASTSVIVTALAAWALVAGVGHKLTAPIQKAMEVAMIAAPQSLDPPRPLELQPAEPPLEAPPLPPLALPDFIAAPDPVVAAPVATSAPPAATASGAADTPPRLLPGPKPNYPSSAIRALEEGSTTLALCVNEAGRVTQASVANSSGHTTLDAAALAWIATARFKPGVVGGKPAAVCGANVLYQWNLKSAHGG